MEKTAGKLRLGDLLVQANLITESQLKLAVREQKRVREPLGRILIELGFITERQLTETLAGQMGIPFIALKNVEIDPALIRLVPADFARQHLFMPIRREEDGTITVAMANPGDVISVDAVQEFLGTHVNILSAVESEISQAISSLLEWEPDDDLLGSGPDRISLGDEAAPQEGDGRSLEAVDRIIDHALRNQATDIHIEPEKKLLRIRYRIDGILHPGENLPVSLTSAVLTRVKILGRLDITERRIPQDGRITLDYGKRCVDFRVSTMPTAHGENIVIRILDRSSVSLNLADLGIGPRMRDDLVAIAKRPYGMLLVSGPTGSGKTTTLYALLLSQDSMTRKTVTIEDPIEYELPLIRQSQVDPGIRYGFAEGLRTILRQDPDVILLGEIRDRETADVAMRASMTGHVVLSSIHTNTALGVVPRLLDIGIDPFLITSSLSGVLAQRLVRKVCPECREAYEPPPEEIRWLGGEDEAPIIYRAKGCRQCRFTGYTRRTALFELVRMDEDFASLVTRRSGDKELAAAAREKGVEFMVDDGKRKVRKGITTIQEVLRVCTNL